MKKNSIRKRSTKRKKSDTTKIILIVCGCFGSLLLIGMVVVLIVFKGSLPLGRGLTLDVPNTKVTSENYALLKSGATISEVEAILGKGRQPNSGDFDAICGDEVQRYTNPYFKERSTWEENNRRGLMRVWVNGKARLIITFSQLPDQGGRLLSKVFLMADNSIIAESGNNTMFPQSGQNGSQPQSPSQPNQSPNANPGEWEKLVGTWEIENEPRFRIRFGADNKMGDIFLHDGRQLREKIYSVREVKIENGRIAPQLELGTVNGRDVTNAAMGVFWFDNGTLHRDAGKGGPIQKLKRLAT
jgi:hypothetical protein